MKFPLPHHPFQQVELTPAQCHDLERVSIALLHETLDEYDRFVRLENRTLHKKDWKVVKTRENLVVYKETRRGSNAAPHVLPKAVSATPMAAAMNEVRLPKLLAVGSIAGTLDDVMYGVIAPDVKAMLLRSAYVGDELVDGGVLFRIKGAVPEDPFQFLGVKWLVKAHPTGTNAVLSPRDAIVIDATGVHVQENGTRVGYHVMHSVRLPECPELKSYSIVRAYLSSCYLFKQSPNGSVEVFMKTFVDPGGRITESLAVMSTATALIGCYKSVLCAQGKKLLWLIKRNARERDNRKHRARRSESLDMDHCCELCRSAFRSYKVARGCVACSRSVCSRCQTTRKISYMERGLDVKNSSVTVCNECVAHAGQLQAWDIARDEYVGRHAHQHSLMTDTHVSSDGALTLLSDEMKELIGSSPRLSESRSKRTLSIESMARQESLRSTWAITAIPSTPNNDQHREQLMVQMSQLRLAAEQTYMITKQNESAMRFQPLYN